MKRINFNPIRAVMLDYINKYNLDPTKDPNEFIQQHLPKLWKFLEKEGMLKKVKAKGFTYAKFVEAAVNGHRVSQMRKSFKNKFRF